jgi:hypothetical protein
LQEAYVSDVGDQMGAWVQIGYKAPGDKGTSVATGAGTGETNNFIYKETVAFVSGSVALATGGVGFTGVNKAQLNDCAKDQTWEIKVADGGSGNAIFTAQGAGVTNADCSALTPQFKTIGK